jgi:hypothetical protein
MSIFDKIRKKQYGALSQKEPLPYGEYPKSWPKKLRFAQAIRHYEIMMDSVELIHNTLSEDVFRARYEAAAREARIVMNLCGKKGMGIRAGRIARYLARERELIVREFKERQV